MTLTKTLIAVAMAGASCALHAAGWLNLDQAHRVAGQKVSSGYMLGKVVLVDRRDYGDVANKEDIAVLKSIWASYRSKPFILLGCHTGPSDAKRAAAVATRLGVEYPVYADAMPEGLEPGPALFLIDATGAAKRLTRPDVQTAKGDVGVALMEAAVPEDPEQYAKYLAFEIANLPGRALLRLGEFRSRFPREAARYDAEWKRLSSSDEIRRLSRLVELARQVKDRDKASALAQKITSDALERAFEKYAPLAKSENPAVAQEAKNALADLRRVSMDLSPDGITADEARKGKAGTR